MAPILGSYYGLNYHYSNYNGNLGPQISETHKERGKELFDIYGRDWNKASQFVKDTWAMVARLINTNYTQRTAPVEFVRFDEELYQCLVLYDCATNGTINKPGGSRGRVELVAAALHQYF